MSLDRRAFLGGLAALSAAACSRTDPCGAHNPWDWIGWEDAETAAKDMLGGDTMPWAGVEGTADRVRAFRDSLDHYALRPRVLVDVRRVDLTTSVLGRKLEFPIIMTPGVLRLPSPEVGDAVIAGVRALGIPFLREEAVVERRVSRSETFTSVAWTAFNPARHDPAHTLAAGIRSVADATGAVARGAHGLVISNDPLQRDNGPSSLDLLPEVRAAVPADVDLVIEGSFRHAGGMLVALGLGARAVVMGWPMVWGAVAAGQAGAYRAVQMLQAELARNLRLCGRPVLSRLGRDAVRHVASLAGLSEEAPAAARVRPGPAAPRD